MYLLTTTPVHFVFNSMYIFFVFFQAKPGTEHGPDALREGGLIKKLMGLGLDVHDYGDVGTPSHEDDHHFDLPVKNPKHVATASENVSRFFNECTEPIVM